MNNPFDHAHIQEEKAEREAHRLKLRTNLLILVFCAVLMGFVGVLYQAQIIDGPKYLSNSAIRDVQSENVDSVRGEILDRYGRVLVTNEISYDVTLDYAVMGSERNEILSRLLDICKEEGVSWSSYLPISESAPWTYTTDNPFFFLQKTENEDGEEQTEIRRTYLGSLAEKDVCNWLEDATKAQLTAAELLARMCATFGLVEKGEVPSQRDRELAGVLYEIYLRRCEVDNSQYIFARGVGITFISKVKENGLKGVRIETDTTRKYETNSAPHVLGYTGAITPETRDHYKELGYPMNATVGISGVELAFEEKLHGVSGTRRIEKDENGNVISQEWGKEPEPGDNVILTLDIALQATTEDLLAQYAARQEEQKPMAAVVVDMSGGVLALASYPTFDLATLRENLVELNNDTERMPLLNRATQGTYAPGSTFKMCTAIAALDSGTITPATRVECTGLYRYYPNPADWPACWINPGRHGFENVTNAIKDSCNIFFYDVGRQTGIKTLQEYAKKFGLGEYTGIEISERKGHTAGPETSAQYNQEWYEGDIMSASIGQGMNEFTPLQLANYVATLVNGGNHYACHLLKECKSSDYSRVTEVYDEGPLDTIDIQPEHLAAVKQGMYDLSKTWKMAQWFDRLPVEVGCKTGTAETSARAASTNAVFVCFAPYDDPQVALCLVAEGGDAGGTLAELAAGILAQYFSTDSSLSTVTGENTLLR